MLRNDGPRVIEAERPATQTNVRTELARIGRQWSVSITRLVELSAELDQSGEWALDGSPTCAHWIASVLDIEVSTAREWLRVGRELRRLPKTRSALRDGRLSYTKVRSVTRLATAENEGELLDIAERTAPTVRSTRPGRVHLTFGGRAWASNGSTRWYVSSEAGGQRSRPRSSSTYEPTDARSTTARRSEARSSRESPRRHRCGS